MLWFLHWYKLLTSYSSKRSIIVAIEVQGELLDRDEIETLQNVEKKDVEVTEINVEAETLNVVNETNFMDINSEVAEADVLRETEVTSSESVQTPEEIEIWMKQQTSALSAVTKIRNKLAGLMGDNDNMDAVGACLERLNVL